MKRFRETVTGILVGAVIGIFYHETFAPYLPFLLILAIVLLLLRIEEQVK